jgi:hypothetical protein
LRQLVRALALLVVAEARSWPVVQEELGHRVTLDRLAPRVREVLVAELRSVVAAVEVPVTSAAEVAVATGFRQAPMAQEEAVDRLSPVRITQNRWFTPRVPARAMAK